MLDGNSFVLRQDLTANFLPKGSKNRWTSTSPLDGITVAATEARYVNVRCLSRELSSVSCRRPAAAGTTNSLATPGSAVRRGRRGTRRNKGRSRTDDRCRTRRKAFARNPRDDQFPVSESRAGVRRHIAKRAAGDCWTSRPREHLFTGSSGRITWPGLVVSGAVGRCRSANEIFRHHKGKCSSSRHFWGNVITAQPSS